MTIMDEFLSFIKESRVDDVYRLLEAGQDPDGIGLSKERPKEFPLGIAQDLYIIEMLIDFGANVHNADATGQVEGATAAAIKDAFGEDSDDDN